MDLTKYRFPTVTKVDMAFCTFKTDPVLLKEAVERGFYGSNTTTPYNDLFNKLFFEGGQVTFKKNISDDFKNNCWAYCKAFMTSFEPRHEEKEAICSMLMSELLDLGDEEKETVWEKIKKQFKSK